MDDIGNYVTEDEQAVLNAEVAVDVRCAEIMPRLPAYDMSNLLMPPPTKTTMLLETDGYSFYIPHRKAVYFAKNNIPLCILPTYLEFLCDPLSQKKEIALFNEQIPDIIAPIITDDGPTSQLISNAKELRACEKEIAVLEEDPAKKDDPAKKEALSKLKLKQMRLQFEHDAIESHNKSQLQFVGFSGEELIASFLNNTIMYD